MQFLKYRSNIIHVLSQCNDTSNERSELVVISIDYAQMCHIKRRLHS